MALQVFNRLTRKKEDFTPLVEGEVRMYVCGPTVYDHAHIGHAKTYVSFDVINRYLRYKGFEVRYVQNITDVGHLLESGEDRILKKAGALSLEPMQIVETYTHSYFDDMDALGVLRPDISPRASGHVPEQIKLTEKLLEKGHGYVTEKGDVYFDVTSYPEYGKLSGQKVEELVEGARVDVAEGKRNAADFALWRHAEPEHLMQWDSPWGRGFPGWHIECSAMSMKYLGETFDIHGGGLENRFPHNECEIAQAEAASGQDFSRYWLLTGSLTINGVQMSKSLGNFITIKEALKEYPAEAIRMFVLTSHYSSPVDYSDDALESARKGWERIMSAVQMVRFMLRTSPPEGSVDADIKEMLDAHHARFIEAMDDDFNAPQALGVLQDLTREVNTLLGSGDALSNETLKAIDGLYRELGGEVLGVIPDNVRLNVTLNEAHALLEMLIDIRAEAREQKNFQRADAIRDELASLGVILEDGPEGTVYKMLSR